MFSNSIEKQDDTLGGPADSSNCLAGAVAAINRLCEEDVFPGCHLGMRRVSRLDCPVLDSIDLQIAGEVTAYGQREYAFVNF